MGSFHGEEFFARATVEVARDLLGMTLRVRAADGGLAAGRIVETEAYGGAEDPASHAARGPTARSRIMFGPPGRLYVYLIYGMHHCLNIVTEKDGEPGAVLIRAIEPSVGQERMKRRWTEAGNALVPEPRLCAGPGRLCRSLGIDLSFNGLAIVTGAGVAVTAVPARAELVAANGPLTWQAGPRIGISRARRRPHRFVDPGSESLSR